IDGVIPSSTYSVSARTNPTMTANDDTSGNDTRTTHVLYLGPGNNPTAGLPNSGWHMFELRVANAGNGTTGVQNNFPFSIAPGGTIGLVGQGTGTGSAPSFVEPVDNGNMNLLRSPAVAVHYTLTKQGTGTLDLQGANTFT